MPHTRTRHCKTCNTLRYNDCKTGCTADDAGNDKNWMTLEAGRQKVTEQAASSKCALIARLKAHASGDTMRDEEEDVD